MLLVLFSCKRNSKDDPAPENPLKPEGGDVETISRIEMHIRDSADVNSEFIVKCMDPDNYGPLPPVADTLSLRTNKAYVCSIYIFDDTKKPVAIVSDEIMQEANYHRFHYNFAAKPGSGAFMQAFITDTDTQIPPQPLGLTFKLKTEGGTGSGNFNLNLRHFANNVPKNGDPQGGEQDILADFPVKISK